MNIKKFFKTILQEKEKKKEIDRKINKKILTPICSDVETGWNPTNEICIDRMVPMTYSVE